ncbi:MAG: hypothetical protein Q4F11_04370 [Eubacteriales bacterium]|nr:hypothetical protein [Eubacteriales bacterium]
MKLKDCFLEPLKGTGRTEFVNVMGLSRGVGATHLAIMLGTYLVHGRHCRVAMIEYGQHGCYENIRKEKKTKRVRLSVKAAQRHAFSYNGLDFYESIYNAGFIRAMAKNYNYIIIDMRAEDILSPASPLIDIWLNGMISIGVMSMVPWKMHECMERLERINALAEYKKVRLVSLTGKENKKINIIPYEPNPFSIKAQNLPWLNEMTGLYYYNI